MNPRLRRLLTIAGLTLGVGYCAIAIAAFFLQRAILFPVPAGAHAPKRASLVHLGDGVVAMHIAAREGQPTAVFFHGNAQQLADTEWLGDQLARQGIGFFAVEYPGYGLAGAKPGPSEVGAYSAAETALKHLEQTSDRNRIVLFGQSLGTGVAVEMAARGHGASMVLVTPYTSIVAIASGTFPYLPARLLVRDPFDTLSKARAVQLPVLLIHGTADEVVPTQMSRALAKEFPRAELMIVEGAHHNDLINRAEVLTRIAAFVQVPRASP